MLISLVWVRADFDKSFGKFIEQSGKLIVIGNGDCLEPDAIGLQNEPVKGFLDLAEPNVGQFAAFDKMALIIVAVAAPQQDDPIDPLG